MINQKESARNKKAFADKVSSGLDMTHSTEFIGYDKNNIKTSQDKIEKNDNNNNNNFSDVAKKEMRNEGENLSGYWEEGNIGIYS